MKFTSILIAGAASIALAVAGVAYAETVVTVSGTASSKAGTKAKPVKFTAAWTNAAADSGGGRPASPITWSWRWNGVTINGKGFPTCTSEQIDLAQSDSVCPKGSLVGQTTKFVAQIGPHDDKKSNATCNGKTVRLYNGGANTVVWFAVGPASECAGVAYLPPFTEKLKTSGGSTTQTVTWPQTVAHALPGLDGGLTEATMVFQSPSRKVGGKTVYYMQSSGCKGKRTMTYVTKDDEGSHTNTVNVGKCK